MSGTVLILGARSDIGMAVARAYAARGMNIILAARRAPELETQAARLASAQGVDVRAVEFDVLATDKHGAFLDWLGELPDIAVSAIGLMGDQSGSESDASAASLVMRSNFEGPALILGELANRFAVRGSGVIVGISSVAGERGRKSNYVYGAAKAGFTAFLSGLRNRMSERGVQVVTVLPGFVNTKMTAGLDLPGALTAEPDAVAGAIVRAVEKGRDRVFVKPVWRLVMGVIRAIPEPVFKKTSI